MLVMGAEEIINVSADAIPELITELGRLGKWLQAFGVIIVLWLIFQVVSLIVNLKKKKILDNIQKDIKNLGKKIDKLSGKKF